MTELSTALARAFERHLEIGGYRGYPTVKASESGISNNEDVVAIADSPVATVATRTAAPLPQTASPVATVATDLEAVATGNPRSRIAENRELRRPVATVATVATETEPETHEAAYKNVGAVLALRQSSSDVLRALGVEACLIEDEADAAAAIADLIAETNPNPRLPIGIDIETMPLGDDGDALDPKRAAIRTVQLYAGGRRAAVIDMTKVSGEVLHPLADARLVAHNALFETRFLIGLLGPVPIDCTMLLNCHLGGPARIRLDELAWQRLGVVVPKEHQVAAWSGMLTDSMIAYAALDAVLVQRLFEKMATELLGTAKAYEATIRALPAVALAANRGICLDEPLLKDVMRRWQSEEETAKAELEAAVPGVDFSKPTQARDFVRQRLQPDQLAAFPRTRTGELSVEKDVLSNWVADIPELDAYARMKAAASKRSRHSGLALLINPATNRIHPDFHLCGAITGRMSCTEPNLQSQERADGWRACFRAGEGRVLVRADFNQIELRIAALFADEERMLAVLGSFGGDIHANTAAATMGVSIESVTKEQRSLAKALNFGLLYGMGAKTFRKYAAKPPVSKQLSSSEAAKLHRGFFSAYPRLREWQWKQSAQVERRNKWTAVTVLGRRVSCAYQDDRGRRTFHYTRSLNVPIQGSGADLLHVVLGKLPSALTGLDACPVLFVHDEIVLEVAESDADEAGRRLAGVMTEAFIELFPRAGRMVNLVDVKIGKTWGD
jgi:DNA polymerase-1